MLANSFFWRENYIFFPDFIKDGYFIFVIFEAKVIVRKIELLHEAKLIKLFQVSSFKLLDF